jgi:hypothetical protein
MVCCGQRYAPHCRQKEPCSVLPASIANQRTASTKSRKRTPAGHKSAHRLHVRQNQSRPSAGTSKSRRTLSMTPRGDTSRVKSGKILPIGQAATHFPHSTHRNSPCWAASRSMKSGMTTGTRAIASDHWHGVDLARIPPALSDGLRADALAVMWADRVPPRRPARRRVSLGTRLSERAWSGASAS